MAESDISDNDSYDESSSDESTSAEEEITLINKIKENKPVRFSCSNPSTMLSIGRSKMGKSTFVCDLIIGGFIKPKPLYYYLCINGKTTEILNVKTSEFTKAIAFSYLGEEEKPVIKVKSTVQEVLKLLDEQNKKDKNFEHIPKMIIVDDQMYGTTLNSIQELVTVYGHHMNAFIYLSAHNLFARNQQHVRDNCDYIVIFPGQEAGVLSRFLCNYPKGVKNTVKELLSSENTLERDGISMPVPYAIPVIIDRSVDKISNNIHLIWSGLDDKFPEIIKTNDEEGGISLMKMLDQDIEDKVDKIT